MNLLNRLLALVLGASLTFTAPRAWAAEYLWVESEHSADVQGANYSWVPALPLEQQRGWGIAGPGFDDGAWKTTDVAADTWSALGLHDYMKSMWYRTTVTLPAPADGKKTHLWLAATDGTAKVFVNGQAIPYHHETVDAAGKKTGQVETRAAADGFCQSFAFDITGAIKEGENYVAVLCTRTTLNELGTGGLMGPVVVYREK